MEQQPKPSQEEMGMEQHVQHSKLTTSRRSFLSKGLAVGGAGVIGASLLANGLPVFAEESRASLTSGDIAILRFLSAAEILETDLWQQYNELGGIQDSEVPGGSGSPGYIAALKVLDGDMPQYIHDNTEDEFTHFTFINAYLVSKGADPVNLDKFRTLPSSKATGAQHIGRLTNLMQLTVDTSYWTKYRSRTKNPDFGDTFPPAVPGLLKGQFPAIPRNDDDLKGFIPGTTPTIPATSRRSPTLQAFILRLSNKVAPASIHRWLSGSAILKFCASCSVSAQPRPHTFKPGMTRQVMRLL